MAHGVKEQQQAELHKTVWQVANDLRGSVDGWNYKSYALGMLFYLFVFESVREHAASNESLDVNSPKLGNTVARRNEELVKLLNAIGNLPLGDTLPELARWDNEPFEAIASPPPYSIKWDGDTNLILINGPRFAPAGVLSPKLRADVVFAMHMLHWLAADGTAAIVDSPSVVYRGGAEQKARKYLIDNNYVEAVIQASSDLFFGTTIGTCVIVLKKSKKTNDVLFVNASEESVRSGNKNKLSPDNLQNFLQALQALQALEDRKYQDQFVADLVGAK